MRLRGLQFIGWNFAGCILNDCHIVECRFQDCQLDEATFFGALFSDTSLEGSNFGSATGVNGIAIVAEQEIERLYDSRDIRMWLHGQGAIVTTDDLPLLQPQVMQEAVGGEALLIHVFSKFFPTGSDAEPRQKKASTFLTSLPPHRKEDAKRIVAWLRKRGVLVTGADFSRNDTLSLAQDWRDEIRSFMKEHQTSDRLRALIADSIGIAESTQRGAAQSL
jgi:uncharacterized protein YjbI with pentapeptide repeats